MKKKTVRSKKVLKDGTIKEYEYTYDYSYNKEYHHLYYKSVKEENEAAVKRWLGGTFCCVDCGREEETLTVFDFHHVKPSEKEYKVSSLLKSKDSVSLLKEIQKCVLLCACCHRIRHATGNL